MSRKLFVMAAMLIVTVAAVGQDFKIGYTNIDAIVFNMPEIAGINSELETQEKQLASMVNTKRAEINKKIQELQAMAQDPNAVQLVLQERENEIRRLNSDLESFSVQVQQAYSQKQSTLLNPVYQKVQTAIDEVRKENGYAMILNAQIAGGGGIVLAANDEDNITKAVFAKLGVPMPKEANADGAPAATTNTGAGN
jgi:outer membrane protein